MYPKFMLYLTLLTFYGATSSKLLTSTDNASNKNETLKHSEFHSKIAIKSDNLCNNENVAVDVILIDNKSLDDVYGGTRKNVNKREAPFDKRKEYKDRPRPDQKSLLIIFDATGSMHDDLKQLRSGAEEIINDLSSRDDSPIFNYVLVVFRDPGVEPPFETRNPGELLEKLKYIDVAGGGDCPEMALSGLKFGLKLALPNSFAYVFSDASAKDYRFYDEVVALIQKKQVTVNFLLTGDCDQANDIQYQVYHKLSRVSNGQVYDMNKSNVKDVLVAIRDTVKHNYAALQSFDVEHAGTSETNLNIDKSISEFKVSIAGKNPKLSIQDPANETIKANEELTLKNLKLVNIKDPKGGTWKIKTSADSSHSIRLNAISDLKFEFGFSLDDVEKKSETAFQPLNGHKNILTLFVSDPSLINDLSNITIILIPSSPSESSRQFVVPLRKINSHVYATKPFDAPRQMFKIQLNGLDANGNTLERLISTGLISSYGSAPELTIEANQKEIYEREKLHLKCIVKSHIPVNISWIFDNQVIMNIFSNQSNELEVIIHNVQHENHGVYKCLAVNKISSISEEISINVLTMPKVKIVTPAVMEENLNYSLKCNVDDAKEQKFDIIWMDEDGNLLQNGGSYFTLTATHMVDKKQIICRAKNKDFTTEDTVILNVSYSPQFINSIIDTDVPFSYGSAAKFDCSSQENPRKTSINWFFKPINSESLQQKINHNDSIYIIPNVIEEHEGTYECVVENGIGKIQRNFSVFLVPKEPPKITTQSNSLTSKESEYVELHCECKNCLPLLNFTWTHTNGKNYEQFFIKNTEQDTFKSIMKLSNVDETDNGTFQCSMWNALGVEKVSIELIVQTTPKIEGIIFLNDEDEFEVSDNYEILEGRSFSVECIVDGFPEPLTYWMLNGNKISNETLLSVESMSLDDQGDYECIAENKLGNAKKKFHVEVNYPPRRKREGNNFYEIPEQENLKLDCNLVGNPRPNISWYFNSRDLESSGKYRVAGNNLEFVASPENSGVYKCIGTNKFGHSSIEFSVVVMTHPKIINPNDESIILSVSSSLKLNCESIGYPIPKIKFEKDAKIISNNSTIEIKSVQPVDSGQYKCIAENQIGIVEKIYYVVIVEKPRILSDFKNITILNDEKLEISCKATGHPEPRVYWKHENSSIYSDNPLTINSTFMSGLFLCVAENSEGTDEKSFNVQVISKPIMTTASDRNVQIKENDDMQISCPFQNYDKISWNLNGNSIDDIQHKAINNKLFIQNINRSHNGNWTCVVSNKAATAEFSYQIDILSSPTILPSWNLNDKISDFFYTESDIDEKVLTKGQNLKLNCTANGSPSPKIQWRKGSDLIGEGDVLAINNLDFHHRPANLEIASSVAIIMFQINEKQLKNAHENEFENFLKFHSDIYTCSAENSQGTVKKFFKVDVTSAPYIDDTIRVQKSFQNMKGDSVILKCNSIVGNPPPLFFWFKDNELLDDEIDDHIIIDSLQAENDGKYRCLAKNKYGSKKIDFEISIYEPARILMTEKIFNNDESLKLTCATQGNPLPVVSWTLNGHILSTTSKMNIDKLMRTVNDDKIHFDGYGNGITFLDPFQLKNSKPKLYSTLTKIDSKTLKLEITFKNRNKLHLSKFTCYSFNALGRDEKSIEIKINQKPRVEFPTLAKVQEFEILETMPLLLSCLIAGYPEPQITWFKNGNKVYENETIEFLKGHKFLRISEGFSWNSGNYSCLAKNELGDVELKFNVIVLSPPKLRTQPNANYLRDSINHQIDDSELNEETIDVLKGSNLILECAVDATPKARIHWIKLNYNDPFSDNKLVTIDESLLSLNTVEESSSFLCYANNSIGNVQKLFHINVQYSPMLIKSDKREEYLTVKLHHSVNLECQTRGSPEPVFQWNFNSTVLTKSADDYYLTTDNQIMRITNANKNHEGKYICTSSNKIGQTQKVFYVKVEIPVQYSPWSAWTECSSSCGSEGLQYRTRTCILVDSIPSYNCSGENVQMRKCNDIPCPVNGGWGSWTNWTSCPKCYDSMENTNQIPKQKRFRKCDNPLPAFGGLECDGNDQEVKECKLSPCPIDGKWSEWSNWSVCSKTCGRGGYKSRTRDCNNPAPKHDGKDCDGENYEYEECKLKPCSNSALIKSLRNDFSESTERYGNDFEVRNDEHGNPRIFQFSQRREIEYSHPEQRKGYKVKVTLDTYKPISEETYNNHLNELNSNDDILDDYFEPGSFEGNGPTEAYLKSTTEKNCGIGFRYNHVYRQCEEIDECKSRLTNGCGLNERCINTIGSYRCEKLF